jgi:hypothetical protein
LDDKLDRIQIPADANPVVHSSPRPTRSRNSNTVVEATALIKLPDLTSWKDVIKEYCEGIQNEYVTIRPYKEIHKSSEYPGIKNFRNRLSLTKKVGVEWTKLGENAFEELYGQLQLTKIYKIIGDKNRRERNVVMPVEAVV